MYLMLIGHLLTFAFSYVASIAVENGVIGPFPEIECNSDRVTVSFNTENTFEGHVFVKGNYDEDGCRADGTGRRAASIKVPFTGCGVRRSRSLNPAGLSVSVTVIISFHPQFLTKVDRAYHVKCFYMEADKTVTNELDVSMLTTQVITQAILMPVCRYEVLAGEGPTGAPIKYANIGDKTYHKWSCLTETVDTFCMTVHSCFVSNGAERKVQLLDENGCAQDKYLLQNVQYIDDLVGGRESHVFKFADKPTLFFNCQIRLTLKTESNNVCSRTSDVCTEPQRGKRSISNNRTPLDDQLTTFNIDVYSDDLNIFEEVPQQAFSNQDSTGFHLEDPVLLQGRKSNLSQICVEPHYFGFIITIVVVIFIASLLAFYMLVKRYGQRKV